MYTEEDIINLEICEEIEAILADEVFPFKYMIKAMYKEKASEIWKLLADVGYITKKGKPSTYSRKNNLLFFQETIVGSADKKPKVRLHTNGRGYFQMMDHIRYKYYPLFKTSQD